VSFFFGYRSLQTGWGWPGAFGESAKRRHSAAQRSTRSASLRPPPTLLLPFPVSIRLTVPALHCRLEEEAEFKEFAAQPGAMDRIFARIAPQVGAGAGWLNLCPGG